MNFENTKKDQKEFQTINDPPLNINTEMKYGEWGEFKYYQDLYINNIRTYAKKTKKTDEYIVTEAARGPKNYLRIVSCYH